MRRAKQVVLQMHHDALEEFDPNLIKWALASQSAAKLKAMVELAQTEKGIAVHLDQLDVDPWLLNCENGTVNLKTLEIHEHRREDLCTRITACPYDPRAKDPVWDKFLRGVLPDADIRTYIQTAAGYTITGDDAEGIMLLAHGPTHTGKTTFLEAIKATLGSYAVTMAIETISRSRHGREPGRARSDLVRLYGARFVSSTEAPENVQLDEARVKEMTGGDTNVARTLYAEEVEATPSWTVWVGSNYRPKVNNADDAVWNRLIELPFTHQHTGKAKDMTIRPHFKRSKKAHAAILSWLIEGLGRYNTDGLIQPAAIMQLTEEYRQQMNPLMPWIDQCGVLDPKAWTSAKRLRESYREFTGHFPGDRMFGQSLARLPGVTEGRRREGGMRQRGWAGIGLLRDDERKWDNDEEED